MAYYPGEAVLGVDGARRAPRDCAVRRVERRAVVGVEHAQEPQLRRALLGARRRRAVGGDGRRRGRRGRRGRRVGAHGVLHGALPRSHGAGAAST
jgi:hypothetical protein